MQSYGIYPLSRPMLKVPNKASRGCSSSAREGQLGVGLQFPPDPVDQPDCAVQVYVDVFADRM